jgi:hypothetical protein
MKPKILTLVLGILSFAPPAAWAVHGQSRTAKEPKFQIEVDPSIDGGPKFTVTNLSAKTLAACIIQFSISSEGRAQSKMDWDPAIQAGGDARRNSPKPLEPGASMTLNLPYKVGDPYPDKVEVIAGVWADGETFGVAEWVKAIIDNRASLISAYEQAISLLQQGLDEKWTRGQYAEAVNSKSNLLPFSAIRSTLKAGRSSDDDAQSLRLAMQDLLAYFTQNLDSLQRAKSPEKVPSNP